MKIAWIALHAAALGATSSLAASYTNPVIDPDCADPTVLMHDGVYYLSMTEPPTDGYNIYTSKDLVHWAKAGRAFQTDRERVWAPDLYFHPEDGRFYLYYTTDYVVGVAMAEKPEGPYEIVADLLRPAIDGHLFRDDDGRLYLYHVRTDGPFRIWVQPMSDPVTPVGEPVQLIEPDQPWETVNGPVTEGPFVLKHEGKYVLLYSGTGAPSPNYAVGMATSDSPMGPFVKSASNPIFHRGDGVFGPGHGDVTTDGAGKLWFVYHQKVNDGDNYRRFVAIDPLAFDEEGVLRGTPTRGEERPVPVPLAAGND